LRPWIVALFLLVAISLGAFGQISLKHGMRQFGGLGGVDLGLVTKIARAVFTPYVLLGLALYAVSSCFWLIVISSWALSYAYPMIALNYVFVVLLSRAIFKETVEPLQGVGILLMCMGLVLVARYGVSTG